MPKTRHISPNSNLRQAGALPVPDEVPELSSGPWVGWGPKEGPAFQGGLDHSLRLEGGAASQTECLEWSLRKMHVGESPLRNLKLAGQVRGQLCIQTNAESP